MSEAYVVDKNLGQPLLLEEGDLPQKNSAGEPVVELTDEQKYLFDVRGWLLVPGVLADDEIEAMREYALRVQQHPESLPEHERSFVAGPLEKLTDHPVVVGFLNEFLAFPGLSSAECYGFRMEGSGLRNPAATPEREGVFNPHNGSGFFRFAVDSHHYQSIPGKSFSGLTYECPAGSVLFFTEALAHSTSPWTNADNERVGIFNLYNSVGSRWSSWSPPAELVEQMPPMRQTLFRGTYCADNVPGFRYGGQNQRDRPVVG